MTTYNNTTFTQEEVDLYEDMAITLDRYNRMLEENEDTKKPYYSDELISKYRAYHGHKKVQELKDAGIYRGIFLKN